MLGGMQTSQFSIDHLAYPSFDTAVTFRFYTEVLGFTLSVAQQATAGPANTPFLFTTYVMPDGRGLDFIEFEGVKRPPDNGLPKVIQHVGVSVGSDAQFDGWLRRLEQHKVPYIIEVRADGRHAFVEDPNGILFELSADAAQSTAKSASKEARAAVDAWVAAHPRRT